MKYGIYSIRDSKTGFYPPMTDQSDQSAIRNFSYAVNNEGVMNYSPKDFDLYRLGEFDTEDGTIESLKVPEFMVSGTSVFTEK